MDLASEFLVDLSASERNKNQVRSEREGGRKEGRMEEGRMEEGKMKEGWRMEEG